MPKFIFTLEALEAKEGDSLLLHYGTKDKPRLIVIDGGPKDVFKNSLSPRLKAIRAARGGGVMEVRMIMVSHIDGDHITGILDLTKELRQAQDSGANPAYDVLTLWHNSFDDIVAKFSAEVQEHVGRVKPGNLQAENEAVAADVKQGRALRFDANALSLNLNSGFDDLVVFETRAKPAQSRADNTLNIGSFKTGPTQEEHLSFLVLGPRRAEIEALEAKWIEDLEAILAKKAPKKPGSAKKKTGAGASVDPAEVLERAESLLSAAEFEAVATAFLDKSIPNLSSIVVLASVGGKTMLLTGDARGDLILDSLRDCGLLPKTAGTVHFDVLKMPHHGSDRNMRKDFLQMVTADHYVFSADGKNGNPDVKTFDMLFGARPKGGYTLWLTNDVPATTKFIKAKKPAKVVVNIRKDPARSLKIELGAEVGV
ncbi:MAG TPA: hypothetical protein VMF52_05460 [Steroidobacteraceae bacterium]|nr:hypothetical protein [Steroidobacteraceae bacterium]